MTKRRLLLVSYQYPPMPFLGGDPWGALAKYLRRLGHDVSVLTTAAYGSLPDDKEAGVVRASDLISADFLRRALRRPPLARAGAEVPTQKAAPALLTRVLIPDSFIASWAPAAALAARRLARERHIDCVITTSPPESAHMVGLTMGRSRPAWVADFRDGWSFEPLRPPFPTAFQRSLDARLERAIVERADAVVAATEPIAEDFRRRYGVDAATVLNSWDPDLDAEAARAEPPELANDRVSLVYTGTLGGVRGHDSDGLLAALRTLAREDPGIAERLELVVAGRLTEDEVTALSRADLAGVVRPVGPLPRPAALALQRRADALLLVTSHHASIVTGKLFEYLAAGRPILALAGKNEAARIVAETRTGAIVAPDDVKAIIEALRAAVAGDLARSFDPQDVERYTYASAAAELAERIEVAIERRTRSALSAASTPGA